MAVIFGAPVAFTIAVAFAVFIAWLIFRFLHQRELGQIPVLKERLAARDDEITRLNRLLKEASEQKQIEAVKPVAQAFIAPPDDNEILHPSSGGVLWRWDPEAGATGPFCPTHPQERLSLKSKHGGIKWKDFDRDYLSFNWFVCPVDSSEEFKSLEAHANRVHELRAQVTDRFRTRFRQKGQAASNEKKDDWSGVFEIEYAHSEIQWRSQNGGEFHFLSNNHEVPQDATLFLRIRAKITVIPPRLLEGVLLSLTGNLIEERDWAPERIDQREVYLCFRLPSSISHGKQPAQLVARALGPNGGIIEKRSQGFDVVIARSYPDFQRFSGTS
ncbi:MAG TPA: hypothetical protein VGX03_39365 [Candidatus Binatia bacterium]|nr:hypothetical protein [Candidatus Binatia bacterium]